MPVDLKALPKEEKFDTKIELLLLPIFILSAKPFSVFKFISSKKKKFTGSRKLFPVVISSMEDLSDGGGLEIYYPFNRDSEEIRTPSMCLVYHFILSSYVTGE